MSNSSWQFRLSNTSMGVFFLWVAQSWGAQSINDCTPTFTKLKQRQWDNANHIAPHDLTDKKFWLYSSLALKGIFRIRIAHNRGSTSLDTIVPGCLVNGTSSNAWIKMWLRYLPLDQSQLTIHGHFNSIRAIPVQRSLNSPSRITKRSGCRNTEINK